HYYSAASVKAGKAAFDVSKLDKLPKVGIVYNHSNASDLPAKAFVENGYQGIVSAGVGNGNIYKSILDTLATAAKEGVVVVRSSRIPFGYTTQNAEVNDSKYSNPKEIAWMP
ncbi:L-asparaginase 2, partial [Enterobacter hormaechei]|nr:L-asparaginase 2 [Enterobacter hormaechei]